MRACALDVSHQRSKVEVLGPMIAAGWPGHGPPGHSGADDMYVASINIPEVLAGDFLEQRFLAKVKATYGVGVRAPEQGGVFCLRCRTGTAVVVGVAGVACLGRLPSWQSRPLLLLCPGVG